MTYSGKTAAITFVTDVNFLVPTLIAAGQIIQQTYVMENADIFIITVGIDEELFKNLCEFHTSNGQIDFIGMDDALISQILKTEFNETHVPKTSLGRFVIGNVLPEQYRKIIYLDGDIFIKGQISSLIDLAVPKGKIAAVPDHIWLTEGESGNFWAKHSEYLRNLDIEDPKNYFNAGVIVVDRNTWEEKSIEALKFLSNNLHLCLYNDQSALNHVFKDRVIYLPLSYNFQTAYASLDLDQEICPKILHFTGGEKPWKYLGPPWDKTVRGAYHSFLARNPGFQTSFHIDTADLGGKKALTRRIREYLTRSIRKPRRRRVARKFVSSSHFETI